MLQVVVGVFLLGYPVTIHLLFSFPQVKSCFFHICTFFLVHLPLGHTVILWSSFLSWLYAKALVDLAHKGEQFKWLPLMLLKVVFVFTPLAFSVRALCLLLCPTSLLPPQEHKSGEGWSIRSCLSAFGYGQTLSQLWTLPSKPETTVQGLSFE